MKINKQRAKDIFISGMVTGVAIASVIYGPEWASTLIVIGLAGLHIFATIGIFGLATNKELELYHRISYGPVTNVIFVMSEVLFGFLISWKLGPFLAAFYLLSYFTFKIFASSFTNIIKGRIENAKCLSCGVKIEYDPDVCECNTCEKISTYLRTRNPTVLDN